MLHVHERPSVRLLIVPLPEVLEAGVIEDVRAEEDASIDDGRNPGEGYVRFSLTPTVEDVKIAAERISKMRF